MPSPDQVISVAIVEDHPEFREALTKAVLGSPDMCLLTVCKDLPEAVDVLTQVSPDVLLVDLGLTNGSGLQLFPIAHARDPRCAPGVLTVAGKEKDLLSAIGAGAKGFLFKSDQEADWLKAIRFLAKGLGTLHPTLAQVLLSGGDPLNFSLVPSRRLSAQRGKAPHLEGVAETVFRHVAAGYTMEETANRLSMSLDAVGLAIRRFYDQLMIPRPKLSPREIQLLHLLNRGYSFKQCAELMGVSESTTKTQASRAYEKLEATNLQSALYEARQFGFLV